MDDDPGHVRLIEKNLRRSGISNAIEVFSSGPAVLHRMGSDEDADEPVLVLLDLNMPGMSGRRVLKELKLDPKTKHIPIIILTTTDDADEMKECYALGCNLFLTKPMDYDEFSKNVLELGLVLQIVATPPRLSVA